MSDIFRDLATRELRIPVVVREFLELEGGEEDGKRGILFDNGWVLMLGAEDGVGGLWGWKELPKVGDRVFLSARVMVYAMVTS